MSNLTDIITYELALLGPEDQIDALHHLSSYAFSLAEAIEAEQSLLDFEAGLATGDYCEDCDCDFEEDDFTDEEVDDLDYLDAQDELTCLDCRVENLEQALLALLDQG